MRERTKARAEDGAAEVVSLEPAIHEPLSTIASQANAAESVSAASVSAAAASSTGPATDAGLQLAAEPKLETEPESAAEPETSALGAAFVGRSAPPPEGVDPSDPEAGRRILERAKTDRSEPPEPRPTLSDAEAETLPTVGAAVAQRSSAAARSASAALGASFVGRSAPPPSGVDPRDPDAASKILEQAKTDRSGAAWSGAFGAAMGDAGARNGSWPIWRARLRAGAWWAGRGLAAAAALSVLWVALYGLIDPPGTLLMARERARLGAVTQEWRSLEAISPAMRRAVIAAEDAKFCEHWGLDLGELRAALRDWREGGRLRGASTISQQTAKNVFLWPDRSYLRKALEFWFTGLIELMWSKERILEVYLNVAEFGEGVFGAEAAAQELFGRSADRLTIPQAARLAAVLPAPRVRDARALGPAFGPRLRNISFGAGDLAIANRDACVVEKKP
ncbi:MAG: monofunctional biosynthetic peptidoglycan transglycosylase [Pseudomonadota bacterium]